ncbi:hypothetical protein QM012_002133 [Aureobasidium pullulans]|uniref:Uncharacterized protein n=1 Tax=Aureobasidium pullulans TaxID=5580 RepID=A0ABR0TB25_AURPU
MPAHVLRGNTFAARYFKQGGERQFDAETPLRDALEFDLDDPEHFERASTDIPLGAVWILNAGDEIRLLCQDDAKRLARVKGPNDNSLWNGDLRFCLGRWQFWKQRFHELQEMSKLDARTRAFAADAWTKMEDIDHRFE